MTALYVREEALRKAPECGNADTGAAWRYRLCKLPTLPWGSMAADCSVVEIGVNDQLMLRQELVNTLPVH